MPKTQHDPPSTVSVPCYLIMGIAAVVIARGILLHFFPKPSLGTEAFPASLLIIDLSQAVLLAAFAIIMLTGRNWARICYFILCAANLTAAFTLQQSGQMEVNLGLAIFETLILGGFLLTLRARRFFAGVDPHRGKAPPNSDHESRIANSQKGRFDY